MLNYMKYYFQLELSFLTSNQRYKDLKIYSDMESIKNAIEENETFIFI